MRIKYWYFSLIIFSLSVQSQILEDQRQHNLLLQGIHQTLQQHYDSAEVTFQIFITENPKHPAGYLYLAGMLQAKFTDYGNSFDEKRYDSLLNIVEMNSAPFMKNKSTKAFGYFYLGSAEAFRSFTRSENGNIPSSIYYGVSAGRSLEKCIEADPAFTEAKNILGSFYYWRSKLAWIPFVPNRSEEGIAMIKESLNHPYQKHLASHNLMVIFIEEKRFAEAESYGNLMLQEYPDNRLFLWNMMTVYEKWGKKKELQAIVERLLQSTLNASRTNYYTEAVCRLKLAQFALAEKNNAIARTQLTSLLTLKKYIGKTNGDLSKKISLAQELLEKIRD